MRNVNECCTVLVKNLIKESFYEKRKKIIKTVSDFWKHAKCELKGKKKKIHSVFAKETK